MTFNTKNITQVIMLILMMIFIVSVCSSQPVNGYNVDYNKLQNLRTSEISVAHCLAQELSQEAGVNDLRFPGGNEGKGLGYDVSLTSWFIDFCRISQVDGVVLRVEVDDYESGYKMIRHFLDAGISIKYVNFGNEEYAEEEIGFYPKNFIQVIFFKHYQKIAYRDAARAYARKLVEFDQYMKNRGIYLRDRLVWCTAVAYNPNFKTWHDELVKALSASFPICDLHFYPDPRFSDDIQSTEDKIERDFGGLRIISTESHAPGFHKLKSSGDADQYADIETRKIWHKDLSEMMDRVGVEYRMLHELFRFDHYESYYGRYKLNAASATCTDELGAIFNQ